MADKPKTSEGESVLAAPDSKTSASRRKLLKTLTAGGGAVVVSGTADQWSRPSVNAFSLGAHAQSSAVIECSGEIRAEDDQDGASGTFAFSDGVNTVSGLDADNDTDADWEIEVVATLSPPAWQNVSLNIDQTANTDASGSDESDDDSGDEGDQGDDDASDFDGIGNDSGGGVVDYDMDVTATADGSATFLIPDVDDLGVDSHDGAGDSDGGVITLTMTSEGYQPCEIIINVPSNASSITPL